LGILTPTGATPSDTIAGTELNPAVLNTTQLDALLGTKAHARLVSPAAQNNDIVLTANQNGAEFNDTHVVFLHDNSIVAGNETATYTGGTLTVRIQSGYSTAADVVAAINTEGTFTASIDYRDASAPAQAGNNPVQALDFGQITEGGSGEVLDLASGLIITNGGKTSALDTSNVHTVEDLVNLINGADLGLVAEVNSARNGINVRSRLNGADLTIGENGGTLATQLGIRTYTADSKLADFNRGLGVPTQEEATDNDVLITARDGTQLALNLSTATTVQDVIDLINDNPANTGSPKPITAQLARIGNGIELIDASTGPGSLTISSVEGSQAAEYLGFVPKGETEVTTNTPDTNGNYVLQSADRNTIESDSVFNTLVRLKQALQENNTEEIGRTINRLDVDLNRVNFARSEIGSRLQSLEVIRTKLEDENVQLRSALSDDMDVDLVEAISNMTARQFALQASLQTSASILQLSLLNFI
jgi:flagellin-like hook-associated protein FlgL